MHIFLFFQVYVLKAVDHNTTFLTNETASRFVNTLQYVQLQHENVNITDYQNHVNNSLQLPTNNTVLLTVFDKIESDNESDGENAKAKALSSDGRKYAKVQPPDPFEIHHDWLKHSKGALDIFILSAIGANSSEAEGYYREIKLNGWQAAKHKLAAIKCCIMWNSEGISEYFYPNRTHQKKQLSLLGSQIACPVKGPLQNISGITIQFAKKTCPENKAEYIRPLIPREPAESVSVAICLKILYGEIDDMALIYWIEYYVEMKVDKIFTFTTEFRDVGKKVPVFWEGEQVVVYDSFSRLHGYTYFAIIDMDEYLLPRKHENIKDMMKYLVQTYPNAAGFTMNSYLFNKNWGISGNQNGSDMEKYVQRTHVFSGPPARPKSVLLPSRIQVDSYFHTHHFTPKGGYKSVTVDENIGAIIHYRPCYNELRHACDRRRAVIDRDILKVIEKIKTRNKWFSELKDKG